MPNVKRRFADDDPSSDDDDDEEEEEEEPQYYRGGGKGLRMPGGKGMGKQLRPPAPADSSDEDDDDDDDDDDEDEEPTRIVHRGGGKQLRPTGGGKQLRAPQQQEDDDDDDDDDDDEEEEEAPMRPVQRGGGKALMQMRPPEDDEDDSEDDDEEEEETLATRVVQRGGGKSLMRMQAPDDDDDDDDDEEEEEEPVRPVATGGGKALRMARGGKQLRAPGPQEEDDDDDDDDDEEEDEPVRPAPGGGKTLRAPRGGGKQLRAPVQDDDDDDDDEEGAAPIRPAPGGGKTLRAPGGGKQLRAPRQQDSDEEDDDDEEEKPKTTQVVQRGGGKSLMRMVAPEEDEEEEDSDEEAEEKKTPPPKPQPISLGGGKQLRPAPAVEEPKEEEKKEPPKPTPKPPVHGGKQLRRPVKEESEDENDDDGDDDEMELDSDEDVKKTAPTVAPAQSKEVAKPDSDDMEESSEESSDEEAELEDMETFDSQRLVKGEEDQKYLDSLPEIEREAILAERFEKRKAEMDMKRALRETKRKEREEKAATKQKDTKKRKAAPAKKPAAKKAKDDDEALAKSLAGKRESGRNKDASGSKAQKAKALAALREERKKVTRKEDSESESDFGDDDEDSDDDYEEAGGGALKPWQLKAQERPTSSRLDQVAASDDEDVDDLKEEEDEVAAAEAGRTLVEASLEDYQKITLPRRRLGRWCNEPYFKEAVMNCFVKLFIGENERGKRCYRLCKIVDVNATKPYQLPPVKNQKPVTTDKLLKLKFAGNSRDFPISLVSDAKIDEADVKQYVDATKAIRQRTLGKKEANKMRRQQDRLVNDYVYTTEDIENNLKNRKKKGETAANLALERTRAAIAVQGARAALKDAKFQLASAKDGVEMQEFQQSVEATEKILDEKLAEEQIVRDRVKNRKQRLTGRTKDQKWAKVNRRALEINQKVDRGEMAVKTESADNSAKKESFNPYARRKVKPKILWEVGQQEEKDDGEVQKDGSGSNDKALEQENGDKDVDSTPSLVQEQQHKAAALSQSHQFAIDEEGLAQSSFINGIAGLGARKSAGNRTRKGLSLTEYQERKAAGTL